MSESGGNGFFSELKRRNVFRVAIAFIVVAWLILQVVDILVPLLALPEWVGRFIFLLLVIGFPIALLFAWAFELTPEGVKLEKNVDRSQSITQSTGRRLNYVIIGVLVVALGISMYANFSEDAEPDKATAAAENALDAEPAEVTATTGRASIAVLPFANRSADESDAFFVDGMHDDLLTQLAKISALKVISRTSVMQYRNTEKSMKIIGDELGVTTLLEGGVQRAGDRIRINVQLIDASTDEHLWAETYDRELTADNIFEIQEEMSLEIANALHAALSPDEQERIGGRPTSSMTAYEAYMLGRQRFATRNADRVAESIDYFKAAVAADENFADAYASMAEAYMVQYHDGSLSKQDMLNAVRPLVSKLDELDHESGIVYNVMGGLAEYEGDIGLAEAYYRKAIEVSPSYTTAYVWLAMLHGGYKRDFQEAARLYRTAADLDPMAILPRINLAAQLVVIGRAEEAMGAIRKAVEIDPTQSNAYDLGGLILAFGIGRIVDGLVWAQKAAAIDSTSLRVIPYYYLALGDFESARLWRDAYKRSDPGIYRALDVDIALLGSAGRTQEAAEVALSLLDDNRETADIVFVLRAIRNYFLSVEREDDAIDLYRDVYSELFADSPDVNIANLLAAVDLVLLLQTVGKEADASRLADRTLPVLRDNPINSARGRLLIEVELHSILGERDKAIDALAAVVDAGWYMYSSPDNPDPNLANIAADPEYLRLMGVMQARADAELAKVREMERSGQLARTPEELHAIEFDLGL